MNRSILIVICDFLLVSLLAFSTVDINKVSDEGVQPTVKVDISTNQPESSKDLTAVMRLALEDERRNRDQLMGELTKTRESMTERDKQAQAVQQELLSKEQQTAQLQQQQANLQQQFVAAQTNIQALSQQLQSSSSEALISREKLAAMEAELRKKAEQAAAMQEQLAHLAQSNQVVLSEKQKLAGELQVAEVEKRHATEQAVRMQEEVKVERAEKAKLADGVKVLASRSDELAKEVRDNRPLAPNTIFNDFLTNRVEARFSAYRPSLLGIDSTRRKDAETVLVSDGTNTYALCHVEDTPLTLWVPAVEWERLTGTLGRDTAIIPVRSVSFSAEDPRIVWIPVSASEARSMGRKIYQLAADPFKFQDAVLVGTREAYYGECKFQIDSTTPQYLKLDHNFLKGLFGKFNPSRGDLVFSKTGQLLGVMANSTYCFMIRNFEASATIRFGQDVRDQHTSELLSRLYTRVAEMPFKLQ